MYSSISGNSSRGATQTVYIGTYTSNKHWAQGISQPEKDSNEPKLKIYKDLLKGSLGEEGNYNMIESIEIVRLYRANREADIQKRYNKKFEELKKNNIKAKEYEELINSFEANLAQLYTSQFEEGQTESTVDNKLLAITHIPSIDGKNSYKYNINQNYYSEECAKLEEEKAEELTDLSELCAKVTAILKICKTKAEIEEELVKYSIYNKKKEIDLVKIVK